MTNIAIISKCEEDRKTISALLAKEDDFRIVGTGVDGFDALKLATTQQPNIIIMDFSMEDISSLDIAPIIKRKSPSTALIVLYSQEEQDVVEKSLRAGISGCLRREKVFDNLVSSVRSVSYGGFYISEKAKSYTLNYDMFIEENLFSPTELGVFRGIILGHTDKEIAKSLNISTGSLRNCINRAKHKTGLHNRTQITIYALLGRIIKKI